MDAELFTRTALLILEACDDDQEKARPYLEKLAKETGETQHVEDAVSVLTAKAKKAVK